MKNSSIQLDLEAKVILLEGQDFYSDKQKENGFSSGVTGSQLRKSLKMHHFTATVNNIKNEDMGSICRKQVRAQSIADRIKSGQLKSIGKHQESESVFPNLDYRDLETEEPDYDRISPELAKYYSRISSQEEWMEEKMDLATAALMHSLKIKKFKF